MKKILLSLVLCSSVPTFASIYDCGNEEAACELLVKSKVQSIRLAGHEVHSARRSTRTTIKGSFICAYSLKISDGSENIGLQKSIEINEEKCAFDGMGISLDKDVPL